MRWNPILVPSDGPILSYMAYLYDTSSNLLSATPFGNKQQNSYTFTGLQTDSSYQVEIVAVNQYGDGNHSVPVKAVTQRSLRKLYSIIVPTRCIVILLLYYFIVLQIASCIFYYCYST